MLSMNSTKIALVYLSLISTIQAMDLCDHKQDNSASAQQVVAHNMRSNCAQDNPTFMQSVARGALTGAMKHACGLNDEPTDVKEAAVGGVVNGAAQGLRRAYVILRHLQA